MVLSVCYFHVRTDSRLLSQGRQNRSKMRSDSKAVVGGDRPTVCELRDQWHCTDLIRRCGIRRRPGASRAREHRARRSNSGPRGRRLAD